MYIQYTISIDLCKAFLPVLSVLRFSYTGFGGDTMNCCVTELRCKDVICRSDGKRIGNIADVEVDTCTGQVVAVVIWGRSRWLGLLGHEDDIRIRWEDIEVIGDDTVIVTRRPACRNPRARHRGPGGKEY